MKGQLPLLLLVSAVVAFAGSRVVDAACSAFDFGSEDGLPCNLETPHPKVTTKAASKSAAKQSAAKQKMAYTTTAYVGFGGQQVSIKGLAQGYLNIFSEEQHQINAGFEVADELLSRENIINQMGFSYNDGSNGVTGITISVNPLGEIKVSDQAGDQFLGEGIYNEAAFFQAGELKIFPGCVEEEESHCNKRTNDFEAVTIETPLLRMWVWGERPSSNEPRVAALNFKLTLVRAPRSRVGGLLGASLHSMLTKRTGSKAQSAQSSEEVGEAAYQVSALLGSDFLGNQFRANEEGSPTRVVLEPVAMDDSVQWPIGRKLRQLYIGHRPYNPFPTPLPTAVPVVTIPPQIRPSNPIINPTQIAFAPTGPIPIGRRRLLWDSTLNEAMATRLPISASSVLQRHLTAAGTSDDDEEADKHASPLDEDEFESLPKHKNPKFASWSQARSVETVAASSAVWGGTFSGRILTSYMHGSRAEADAAAAALSSAVMPLRIAGSLLG